MNKYMKRLTFLIASIALVACTSLNGPTKTIELSITGVQSGSLATKSLTDVVSSALAATAPGTTADVVLQSTSKSSRIYTGVVGTPMNVAYDTYNIFGDYDTGSLGTIFFSRIYHEPIYSLGGTITVTEADDVYPIAATYECFAVVVDFTKVQKIEFSSSAKAFADCTDDFYRYEDIGIVYLSHPDSYTSSNKFVVRVYPKDEANYEYTEYTLTGTGTNSTVKIEKGKWYAFSPTAVETTTGDFSITFPEFTQAEID